MWTSIFESMEKGVSCMMTAQILSIYILPRHDIKVKVKVSHKLVAIRAARIEAHFILGTAYVMQSPSFSFCCLRNSYPFTAGLTEGVFQSPGEVPRLWYRQLSYGSSGPWKVSSYLG